MAEGGLSSRDEMLIVALFVPSPFRIHSIHSAWMNDMCVFRFEKDQFKSDAAREEVIKRIEKRFFI